MNGLIQPNSSYLVTQGFSFYSLFFPLLQLQYCKQYLGVPDQAFLVFQHKSELLGSKLSALLQRFLCFLGEGVPVCPTKSGGSRQVLGLKFDSLSSSFVELSQKWDSWGKMSRCDYRKLHSHYLFALFKKICGSSSLISFSGRGECFGRGLLT